MKESVGVFVRFSLNTGGMGAVSPVPYVDANG
jgi:phosphoribosylamine-glycine ligase